MKSRALLSVVLSAAVICAPAVAGQLSFLNGTIASHIPAKDLPAFKEKIGEVLNQSADNAESTWQSTPSRKDPEITITFKPLSTTQTKSAQTCRLLAANISQRTTSEAWQFWFCKQEDGAWKASSTSK